MLAKQKPSLLTVEQMFYKYCRHGGTYFYDQFLPDIHIHGTKQINTRSGPQHVNTRRELVFHTTSRVEFRGRASIYSNLVTVWLCTGVYIDQSDRCMMHINHASWRLRFCRNPNFKKPSYACLRESYWAASFVLPAPKRSQQRLWFVALCSVAPPSVNWTLPAVFSWLQRPLSIWRPSDALSSQLEVTELLTQINGTF